MVPSDDTVSSKDRDSKPVTPEKVTADHDDRHVAVMTAVICNIGKCHTGREILVSATVQPLRLIEGNC